MPKAHYPADHDACGVGFITQLGAKPSHEVVERALTALQRLSHRGGLDADGRSGDGAGLLTALPDRFLRKRAGKQGIALPKNYAVGMLFVAPPAQLDVTLFEMMLAENGLRCLGWRTPPTNSAIVGPRAQSTLPHIQQCFLAPVRDNADLELQLFRFRKQFESRSPHVYFCSLSSRTLVYKGLLTPEQLPAFYLDLADPEFETTFAIFHQRYSTNTQPSWSMAQPFRFIAQNGEINTISSNRRWLHARQPEWIDCLGLPLNTPIVESRVSDSATVDNAVELNLRKGMTPAETMMGLMPPAWEGNPHLSPELRRFLESCVFSQEPWDGPAALVFSDGLRVGAKLDRNGLRPLRYTRTADGWLIVGSEVGIADLHGKQVIERQRLGPGEMLLANP